MILIDTSPILAMFEPREEKHLLCVEAFNKISENLVTTIPCLTELMYFLYELRGWKGQQKLWQLIETKSLVVHQLTDFDLNRMNFLMEKYQDTPMDFADASLVAAAESLKINKIFTLDSDFYVYRINEKENFEVIP
jgi:uncharacterized protein